MYKGVRIRFSNNIHLAADELPDEVTVHRYMYHADKPQSSLYGTFGEY